LKQIVIVEYHPHVLKRECKAIQQIGHNILGAYSDTEATKIGYQALINQQLFPDLVIVGAAPQDDRYNTLDIVAFLRTVTPTVRIAITYLSMPSETNFNRYTQLGITHFLRKMWESKDFSRFERELHSILMVN
jgi:response regulator RpfG family c-di-GMP phosphodiesterase